MSSRFEGMFFPLLITRSLTGWRGKKRKRKQATTFRLFKKQLGQIAALSGRKTQAKEKKQSATQNLDYITHPLRDEITHTNPERSIKPSAAACFCTLRLELSVEEATEEKGGGSGGFRGDHK